MVISSQYQSYQQEKTVRDRFFEFLQLILDVIHHTMVAFLKYCAGLMHNTEAQLKCNRSITKHWPRSTQLIYYSGTVVDSRSYDLSHKDQHYSTNSLPLPDL